MSIIQPQLPITHPRLGLTLALLWNPPSQKSPNPQRTQISTTHPFQEEPTTQQRQKLARIVNPISSASVVELCPMSCCASWATGCVRSWATDWWRCARDYGWYESDYKQRCQNLVPTRAFGTKLVPKALVGTKFWHCSVVLQEHLLLVMVTTPNIPNTMGHCNYERRHQ
jgi:hypothetical protein